MNWMHFKAGAECGRAVKALPAEHRDALTKLFQAQRRQLLELGVKSAWHDGALLELEPVEDIEGQLVAAVQAVMDPTPVDDETARDNLRRVRETARELLRREEELPSD